MGFSNVEDSTVTTEVTTDHLDWRPDDDNGEEEEGNSAEELLAALQDKASRIPLEEGISSSQKLEFMLPEWFDKKRYQRGVETFERNIFVMFSGKMAGLLSLLAVPSIVKVLVLTGKSADPDTAFRRYVDTVRHMLFWYRSDLTQLESTARQSVRAVRAHHMRGSSAARRAGLGGFTQLDLVLTQFAFFGYVVLRREMMSVKATEQDILDFVHVWRTIGHLIGVQDRFNPCRFDIDLIRTDQVLEGICTQWLVPAFTSPPSEFAAMSRALITGLWCMMPVLEYESFVCFTQELAGVPESKRCHPSSRYKSFLLWMLHLVPNSMSWPIAGHFWRAYHNINMRFSLYMSTYYPLLAWYSFPGNSNTRYHKLVPNER